MLLEKLPLPQKLIALLKQGGIEQLNPPQVAAIKKGLLDGKNMVIASPTASGKTLIAEMAILKNYLEGKKSVYLVPLKALASEKYEDFSKYKKIGMRVGVSTGDLDSSDSWLGSYDLVILSNEKMDSLLRHGVPWAKDIALIVSDEIHLIDDPTRGPTLEVVLTQLAGITRAQIVALSATIENAKEIAEWLDAELVKSDYRPVKLHKGVMYPDSEKYKLEFSGRKSTLPIEADIETAICLDTTKKEKQTLMFVSTRRSAESVAEKLSKDLKKVLAVGEREKLKKLANDIENVLSNPTKQCRRLARIVEGGAAFHHAGLVGKQRKLIEDAFRSGSLKVLAATPTLAFGMNLPAYRVVIRDTKRFTQGYGATYLPVIEIHQMCVPYDSEVLMSDGTSKKIGELVEKNDEEIISVETKKFNSKPAKILKKFKRTSREFIKIKAGSMELTATPEHPLLVLRGGKPEWLKISELKKGEHVGMISNIKVSAQSPRFLDLLNHDTYVKDAKEIVKYLLIKSNLTQRRAAEVLNIRHKTLKSYCYNKAIPLHIMKNLAKLVNCDNEELSNLLIKKHFKSKYGNEIILPKVLDEKFAWFLGVFAAEGSIVNYIGKGKWKNVKYRKLKISSVDGRIISKLENILNGLGVKYWKGSQKGGFKGSKVSVRLEIANQVLADIINNLGVPSGAKSYTVDIGKVYSFPKNLVGAYLAGVFDGDGNLNTVTDSVRLSSRSKKLIEGCKNLLLRLNIHASIYPEGQSYTLGICRKSEIEKFLQQAPSIRFENRVVKYVRNTRPIINIGDVNFERVSSIKRIKTKHTIPVYNLSIECDENFICNGFVVHNCGRAGRPKYDTEGEAILLAKSEAEAKALWERYISGDAEPIYSKLGVERVLRIYILSLISSGYVKTRGELETFFMRTFFAKQYGDIASITGKIERIITELENYKFIIVGNKGEFISKEFMPAFQLTQDVELRATKLGKRVSELYLDPVSANLILSLMTEDDTPVQSLMMICQCSEMYPLLSVKKKEYEDVEDELSKSDIEAPDVWDVEYEDFLSEFKTALLIREWTNESGEDVILEKYGVTPGELYNKTTNAEWLLYSASELAMLLGIKEIANNINKVRLQVKHGVKEELLKLVTLKGIGRARARKLFNAGIRTPIDIKKADEVVLAKLLGQKVAKAVKSAE